MKWLDNLRGHGADGPPQYEIDPVELPDGRTADGVTQTSSGAWVYGQVVDYSGTAYADLGTVVELGGQFYDADPPDSGARWLGRAR